MTDYIRNMTNRLFGKHLEFRVRLFNILALAGTLISISMFISGLFTSAGAANAVTNIIIATLSAALLRYSYKSGNYQLCYTVSVAAIFLGLFSALFFNSGGYHAGMPSFFIFAVLFTVFMLDGVKMIALSCLELVWYTALCLWAYYHPEQINNYDTEAALMADIVISVLVVSAALGITMALHFRLYNQQQKELEAARKQAEEYARMKSELFADMSHEMRTPLTVMSGYAQYAVEQIRMSGVNEQTLADLATIGEEAKRLSEMADGTLKILMTANREGPREATEVDIGVLAARLAHLFGAIATRKGRKLTAEIEKNIPSVSGDMDGLTQLLWNVLQNAITHSDGDIILLAKQDGNGVKLTVSDNGAGIPPELLPHIFERGVSGREGGSGIGLAICLETAKRHGGELQVESNPETGTVVTIWLPTSKEAISNDRSRNCIDC